MINYHLKMEEIINNLPSDKIPSLLLHACCAPCSSYVLEILSKYFNITIFYYNPNITPKEEFDKRIVELKKLVSEIPHKNEIKIIEGSYDNDIFENRINEYKNLGERSKRCFECYSLRLEETVKLAKEKKFDFFTTTLSISPYKNANWLNEIGEKLEKKYNIKYLYADFKKNNGYKRSIELSLMYDLYRQDYCGCIYSKKEEEVRKKAKYEKCKSL